MDRCIAGTLGLKKNIYTYQLQIPPKRSVYKCVVDLKLDSVSYAHRDGEVQGGRSSGSFGADQKGLAPIGLMSHENERGLCGNLPTNDDRPNDNKCQSLV
ncbi:hypothetical protein EYF80_038313 [Liparis tanakae]|uniref:Uncharacterized protein n=1 Tax=Liparis tanakae TaxID=230148 RepID=A0A4Z2GEZ5_9TELE|nr:hypothetical protein EYF80_038313 [Liparis tanakae]